MIKTVIIDRQKAFLDCLTSTLNLENDFSVCGTGENAIDAAVLAGKFKPELAILEFELEKGKNIPLINSLKKASPETRVIYIARMTAGKKQALEDKQALAGLALSRAPGCISRDSAFSEIVPACRTVCKGNTFMTPVIAEKAYLFLQEVICEGITAAIPGVNIPVRDLDIKTTGLFRVEYMVASCVGQGLTNPEIAEELKITEGTVRNHISSILRKTGLENRTQVALRAINGGFVQMKKIRRSNLELRQELNRSNLEKQPVFA
jgi:DNA-binding NarL/FixJ family response regulator